MFHFVALNRLILSCSYLSAHKSVNLQHANLKVARGTQRRIVERLTPVRLAETNVLVHPNGLSVTVNGHVKGQ